ncbi:glutathione binding-like protein [Halomonas aquatica]|uniref:glutathione binding-like protein n=1 Tax=Halomonas aquatica TaxID=3151123 RepID=UPI003D80EAF2
MQETARLYGVLDRRLEDHDFLGGDDYSIADMASYPWVRSWQKQGQDIEAFPSVLRWMQDIEARPAVRRAYALGEEINPGNGVVMDEEARRHLFERR